MFSTPLDHVRFWTNFIWLEYHTSDECRFLFLEYAETSLQRFVYKRLHFLRQHFSVHICSVCNLYISQINKHRWRHFCCYETWNEGFYKPKTYWFDPLSPFLLLWNAWMIWIIPSTTFRKKYQCHLLYLVSDYSNFFQSQIKYLQKHFLTNCNRKGSLFLLWRSPYPAVFTGTSFIKLCCLSSVILSWPTSTHTNTQYQITLL